ncbi:hypothetical protein EN816_00945 [Mesorhizobium sp. M8A.F.Ca.ET.173.01.1.1]|nr:hypothetical protein EN816_00945 [Mesorhizobium sp. M8A.F.Ca.ET.173.01.1.1]
MTLDEAVAQVQRELPGWWWKVANAYIAILYGVAHISVSQPANGFSVAISSVSINQESQAQPAGLDRRELRFVEDFRAFRWRLRYHHGWVWRWYHAGD